MGRAFIGCTMVTIQLLLPIFVALFAACTFAGSILRDTAPFFAVWWFTGRPLADDPCSVLRMFAGVGLNGTFWVSGFPYRLCLPYAIICSETR